MIGELLQSLEDESLSNIAEQTDWAIAGRKV